MLAFQLFIYQHLPRFIQLFIRRRLFPTYLVCAKVLVTNSRGQFLAVRTTYNAGWDIPSGHCDRGESPTIAAARELYEETGIKIESLQQRGVIFQPRTNIVQVLFAAEVNSNVTPKPDNVEISEVRWVNESDVDLTPHAREAIDVLLRRQLNYFVSELDH